MAKIKKKRLLTRDEVQTIREARRAIALFQKELAKLTDACQHRFKMLHPLQSAEGTFTIVCRDCGMTVTAERHEICSKCWGDMEHVRTWDDLPNQTEVQEFACTKCKATWECRHRIT